MHKSLSKNAFSLVEVTVAGTIFAIAVIGIFASMGALKKPAGQTNQSLKAAYCGQQILETFRANVDSRDWDSADSRLELGTHTIDGGSTPAISDFAACSGISSVEYVVSSGDNGTRKVVATVNY